MKKVLFFSMLACAFVACGGGNVDKVKNATLRGYDTMTISAAIEGSKICASIKYEDVSKDGLNLVKMTCTENQARIKERYEKELAKNNEYLSGYMAEFRKVVVGEISDDEIKEAAQKYVVLDTEKNKMFPNHKFDKNEFKEFMDKKDLKYKNGRNLGWGNPLIDIARTMSEAPKLPKSVVYEINFIIKPDGSIDHPKDIFALIDGDRTQAGYSVLNDFYKRESN